MKYNKLLAVAQYLGDEDGYYRDPGLEEEPFIAMLACWNIPMEVSHWGGAWHIKKRADREGGTVFMKPS